MLAQFPGIPASLANSAGLMTGRDNHFQMVRPGISLYGGRAVSGRRNPMCPVATLEAPILQIKEVKTGEIRRLWRTADDVARQPPRHCRHGYADGFLRSLSSANNRPGGKVFVRGQLARSSAASRWT